MSKNRTYVPSKENNWIDKHSTICKEDEAPYYYLADKMRFCIDSDSILDWDEESGYINEIGKNKELGRIQKVNKSYILKKNHVKVTRRSNERKGSRR